mgnify:FL=1
MSVNTIFLIIISILFSVIITYYQYYYRNNSNDKIIKLLAILRFFSWLTVFLLLINPVLSKKNYETQKIPLPVVLDNSSSIKELKANEISTKIYEEIGNNNSLKDKYNLQFYTIDEELKPLKKLDFTGKSSLLYKAGKNFKNYYRNTAHPVIFITDGNQTSGNDFVYSFNENTTVYPVIAGDTTKVFDIKINQINVNKYAFLKNKFPVEIFLQYNGNKPLSAQLNIANGANTVFKQNINFSKQNSAQVIQVLLNAAQVGVQNYKVEISSLQKEINSKNNTKHFAVEVIDQRTEISLITAIQHPDIGTIKRSIEANAQRKVNVFNINEIKSLEKFSVVVFYQPNATFKNIISQAKNANLNCFYITGKHTDFNFLKNVITDFTFNTNSQNEFYSANYVTDFNLFAQQNISFEQFAPLENKFGNIVANASVNTLLHSQIKNIKTDNPLLCFTENVGNRNAFLFGEGIWKWRMQTFENNNSFTDFDLFLDKIIQYLATKSGKKRLMVSAEKSYNSGEEILINAQYFNKNYELDTNAQLSLQVTNMQEKTIKNFAFIKSSNDFSASFALDKPGKYNYRVLENISSISENGSFEIISFDAENQFVNPDIKRLEQLANKTNGKVFYNNNISNLISLLLNKDIYKPIEKSIYKKTPLIEWKSLLLLLVLLLSAEWLIRKYNGLL